MEFPAWWLEEYFTPELQKLIVGFSGIDPSRRTKSGDIEHNETTGLQGGHPEQNEYYHLSREQYESLEQKYYRGVFDDEAALVAAYPTDVTGAYAVLLSTETFWVWNGTEWTDTGKGIDGLTNLPPGGTTGQVLTKASNEDGDAAWMDPTGGSGGPEEPGKALWDFSHVITAGDLTNKYFDVPADDPDILDGEQLRVIMIVDGVAQFAGDYAAINDDAGKLRRISWAGLPLESNPSLKVGDKVWIIYPALVSEGSGGGGGGGDEDAGTSDHEELDNLYPESIGNARHNHLTDEQLGALEEVIDGDEISHEKLADLLPEALEEGNHYHLAEEQMEALENVLTRTENEPTVVDHEKLGNLLPVEIEGEAHNHLSDDQLAALDEVIDEGEIHHEKLAGLLPETLNEDDHFHVTKEVPPDRPDIVFPLDNSDGHVDEHLFIAFDYTSLHGYEVQEIEAEVYNTTDILEYSSQDPTYSLVEPVATHSATGADIWTRQNEPTKGYGLYIPWLTIPPSD
jgi:hypothetical protein